MRRRIKAGILATLLAVLTAPIQAHHSFSLFDMGKTVTFKGTVKELEWTNPHVWIDLTVMENNKAVTYSFEGAAIAVLKRVGWNRDSVKAGDVITVVGHPYKDGRPGGCFDHVVLADGRKLGTGDALPGALRVPGVE